MEEKKPEFAFEKKIGIAECLYRDIPAIHNLIGRLLFLIQESNKINNVECEFFRLDFRYPFRDEIDQFPYGSLILDMKWGSKKELERPDKHEN